MYKAWTTPDLVKRWWSGQRGEMTLAEIDLRVGGMWRYVMVANRGFEVAFHGEYREIVARSLDATVPRHPCPEPCPELSTTHPV